MRCYRIEKEFGIQQGATGRNPTRQNEFLLQQQVQVQLCQARAHEHPRHGQGEIVVDHPFHELKAGGAAAPDRQTEERARAVLQSHAERQEDGLPRHVPEHPRPGPPFPQKISHGDEAQREKAQRPKLIQKINVIANNYLSSSSPVLNNS